MTAAHWVFCYVLTGVILLMGAGVRSCVLEMEKIEMVGEIQKEKYRALGERAKIEALFARKGSHVQHNVPRRARCSNKLCK